MPEKIISVSMARRNNTVGGGKKSISITLNLEIVDKMDEKLNDKSNNFGTRSSLIEYALDKYLSYTTCPYCKLQVPKSKYCAECGRDISISQQDRDYAEFLYEEQHPEHRTDGEFVVKYHLTDSQIYRLLHGEVVEADNNAHRVPRDKYRKNLDNYLKRRKE